MKRSIQKVSAALAVLLLTLSGCTPSLPGRWSADKAAGWYSSMEWPVGCDYIPAYAGNQFEMWQSETWNPDAVDRELAKAEGLGFNTVRIFLHHGLWEEERDEFFSHIDEFLTIADSHGISTLMTLFTNGGSEMHRIGEKAEPVPGIHNSMWAQTPGMSIVNDPSRWGMVERYEKDVLRRFAQDDRIIAWCIYNEPENVPECNTLPLLREVFRWAREVNPSQPLTATLTINPYNRPKYHMKEFPMMTFICENSDILSFHCYGEAWEVDEFIDLLVPFGRPVFCTEYMARPYGCTFETVMPVLKERKVAAYSFGLVNGRTQLHYEWNRVEGGEKVPFESEPELWFHDIFRSDGTPWSEEETDFIKSMTE